MAAVTHTQEEWTALAAELRPAAGAVIGGEISAAASGETFESVNPATGEILAEVTAGDIEDVDRAVRSGRRGIRARRLVGAAPSERKAALLRLAELIDGEPRRARTARLARHGQAGRGRGHRRRSRRSPALFQWYGEAIDKLYDEIAPTGPGDLAMVTREPLGVVGAVVPWNFPLDLASWKVAPALAAGNSVVLKPAEQSPLSAIRLGELALEAGMPARRFQRRAGLRGDGGPGARPASRRRLRRLHRLDRGRQALPLLPGRVERQAGLARVRRQEPEPRLRRRPGPRRRRRHGRLRDLLQPGRGLLRQLPTARRALHPRGAGGEARRAGARRPRSATRSTRGRRWARSSTRATRSGSCRFVESGGSRGR